MGHEARRFSRRSRQESTTITHIIREGQGGREKKRETRLELIEAMEKTRNDGAGG